MAARSDTGPPALAGDWPRPSDPARARLGLDRWREQARQTADPDLRAFAEALAERPDGRAALEAVFGNSPFLTDCLIREIAFFRDIVAEGYAPPLDRLLSGLREAAAGETDTGRLMGALRRAKRRCALLVGLADIAGAWPLEQVCAALSDFAETSLGLAARHLLRRAAASGDLDLADESDPERGSGLIVLGMGKLGARELNYSSDIDLIVLYDDGLTRTTRPDTLARAFIRLTRDLVRIMEERTADGYVFRTDLRLRPDAAATPIAISAAAAESYYGSMALNWERAAMIKARPVAGDRAAAESFLAFIRQFVWRRHLDFAAIEDIHRIRRQVHRQSGSSAIVLQGHNLKTGRGGIRDIEFFVQTQQLIFGGRDPSLRVPATVPCLGALAAAGRIDGATAAELSECYGWLRRIEHRLQMVDDQQTHSLPKADPALDALGVFLNVDDPALFRARLRDTLARVERRCAGLFETPSSRVKAPFAFGGVDDDPETLKRLAELGFDNPKGVSATVRGWLSGRYRATRSERGRQLLADLLPDLLHALARTAAPDAALFRFDELLGRLPAGIQFFSLFLANPPLLDLLAEILGTSPRLAGHLARNPAQLDVVLTPGFLDGLPDRAAVEAELRRVLAGVVEYEDVLNAVRRWTNDERFRAGMQTLRHACSAAACRAFLSDLADLALATLQPHVADAFARVHGRFAEGGLAIVGLGKLGGREMSIRSDLDLIMIYDPAEGPPSDGPKPLPPAAYYTRLCQRLVSAITVPTHEGALFEVDMRLRPSGNKGPLATSLEAFLRYQREDAWTWEHMALTRARVISAPPALAAAIEAAVAAILRRERDPERLLHDVADMRRRIERTHAAKSPWDVKYRRGGLVDIEFIAQYLQLRHAAGHPAVLHPNTAVALGRLQAAGLLASDAAADLAEALEVWQRVQAYIRLTQEGEVDAEAAPLPLKLGLARAVAGDAGATLGLAEAEARMQELADRAHGRFRELIESPAAEIDPASLPQEGAAGRA